MKKPDITRGELRGLLLLLSLLIVVSLCLIRCRGGGGDDLPVQSDSVIAVTPVDSNIPAVTDTIKKRRRTPVGKKKGEATPLPTRSPRENVVN